jgi:hypothetical protein
VFTPIKAPGPPPDLQQGRLKQWLQDTFKAHADTLKALALASNIAKPTYGPTVTPDLSQGGIQHIVATDGKDFTIQAPTNIGPLAQWQLIIENQAGAGLGNVSFDSSINQFGFADPGSGGRAIANFVVDGGKSYQVGPWQGVPVAIYNVPYGPTVTPDLSKGIIQEITVTDSNPFTIAAPANAAQAGYWELVIRNQSGGSIGAVTFDPEIKQSGFAGSANGTRTSTILHQEGGFTHQDAPWTGSSSVQQVTVSLTALQVASGVAVQMAPAPGPGLYIVPIVAALSASAGGFSGSAARMQFGYGASLNNPFITSSLGFLTLVPATPAIFTAYPNGGTFSPASNVVNQAAYFQASGITGGSGTVEISFVYYSASA